MLAGVGQTRFRDGPWVERLLQHFAGYYFDALDLYDQERPDTPPVWKQTHDATRNDRIMILQHLFLGINAHINYDLVLTLVDVLGPDWAHLGDIEKRARYDDHRMVNTIIGETIDAVQDQVEREGLRRKIEQAALHRGSEILDGLR